jgi:hypothetical protein
MAKRIAKQNLHAATPGQTHVQDVQYMQRQYTQRHTSIQDPSLIICAFFSKSKMPA